MASEEIAEFDPPSDFGEALERAVISWWRQAGKDWPPPPFDPVGLTEFHDITDLAQELTVWLQVWYKMDDTPSSPSSVFKSFASYVGGCFLR